MVINICGIHVQEQNYALQIILLEKLEGGSIINNFNNIKLLNILLFIVFSVVPISLNAGVAIYFIKDKQNNLVDYRVYFGQKKGTTIRGIIYSLVKNRDFDKNDKVFDTKLDKHSRYSIENSGDIASGYYVIISNGTRYKNSPRYGVGFSATSKKDAEQKAIKNLSGNDWSWSLKQHGYNILESNSFPESKCSKAFSSCLQKAQNGTEKKECAIKKKRCEKDSPSRLLKSTKVGSSGVRG